MNTLEAGIGLETKAAIESLLTEFAFRVDHGLAETVHELFIADATVSTPAFVLNGRDEIQARFAARAKDTSRRTRHFWSNLHLRRDGEAIVATTNALTVVAAGEAAPVLMGGSSRDVCVCVDGAWRFKTRALTVVFDGSLAAGGHA